MQIYSDFFPCLTNFQCFAMFLVLHFKKSSKGGKNEGSPGSNSFHYSMELPEPESQVSSVATGPITNFHAVCLSIKKS